MSLSQRTLLGQSWRGPTSQPAGILIEPSGTRVHLFLHRPQQFELRRGELTSAALSAALTSRLLRLLIRHRRWLFLQRLHDSREDVKDILLMAQYFIQRSGVRLLHPLSGVIGCGTGIL